MISAYGGSQTAYATSTAPPPAPDVPSPWRFFASIYAYFPPDDPDYAQPTVMLDHQRLHLEARYNYEDLDTASAWVGRNFSLGDTVTLALTPMLGGVFGQTMGLAPGLRGTLGWRRFELFTETEFVVAARSRDDSFVYSWSEASVAPLEWLRLGLVAQRTRTYQSEREVQPGFLVGLGYKQVGVTAHVFNPDERAFYVISVAAKY